MTHKEAAPPLLALAALCFVTVRLCMGDLALYHRGAVARLDLSGAEKASKEMQYALRTLVGVEPGGEVVFAKPPRDTSRFAAFVIRGASFAKDTAYWNSVARALQARKGVYLIGFCDGSQCRGRSRNAGLLFPLAAYGEVVELESLMSADRDGLFLVTDSSSHVVGRVRWRPAAPAAAAVVAELEGSGAP